MKSIANRQRVDEDQRKFRFGHRDKDKSTDLDEEEQRKLWMFGRKSANPQCLNGGVRHIYSVWSRSSAEGKAEENKGSEKTKRKRKEQIQPRPGE